MTTETDLELSARNYNGIKWNSMIKTLKRLYDKGVYDSDRASGYIERHLVTDCAKYLHKKFSDTEITWQTLYPLEMRKRIADNIESEIFTDFTQEAY